MTRTFDTTRLDAVNEMLSVVGEAPVNSLSNASSGVRMAENILDNVDRELQTIGWHWNVEQNYDIAVDGNGKFPLPKNWIRIDTVVGRYGSRELQKRGGFVYDVRNRTYVLTGITSLRVTATIFLDYDELPESARRYIMIRAARMYQDRVADSERHHRWTQEDELRAWTTLLQAEAAIADYNIFQTPLLFGIVARGETPLRDVGGDTRPPPLPIEPAGG